MEIFVRFAIIKFCFTTESDHSYRYKLVKYSKLKSPIWKAVVSSWTGGWWHKLRFAFSLTKASVPSVVWTPVHTWHLPRLFSVCAMPVNVLNISSALNWYLHDMDQVLGSVICPGVILVYLLSQSLPSSRRRQKNNNYCRECDKRYKNNK